MFKRLEHIESKIKREDKKESKPIKNEGNQNQLKINQPR